MILFGSRDHFALAFDNTCAKACMTKVTPKSRPFYFMYQYMCYPFFTMGSRSTVRKIFFNGANLMSGSKSLCHDLKHVVVIHYIIIIKIEK